MRVVVLLDPCILLGKKVQKVEARISKIKYRATANLEMGKLFAFFLFYDLDLVVSQIAN